MIISESIILALIGFAGVCVTSLGTLWLKNKLENNKKDVHETFLNVIPRIHDIYTILNKLKSETNAVRVLILKTENNGGRPKAGCQLKSSVIYEVCDSPLKPVKDTWQYQVLDEEYVHVMSEMMLDPNKRKEIIREELDPTSILYNVYVATNVAKSVIYEIQEREKEYIYISIIYDTLTPHSPEESDSKRIYINQLRQLFKQND